MQSFGTKHLTFQFYALLPRTYFSYFYHLSGFTLVITPLVSLMEDQLMYLKTIDVSAVMLNASSSRVRTACHVEKDYFRIMRVCGKKRIAFVIHILDTSWKYVFVLLKGCRFLERKKNLLANCVMCCDSKDIDWKKKLEVVPTLPPASLLF